jgi:hypothetical protein
MRLGNDYVNPSIVMPLVIADLTVERFRYQRAFETFDSSETLNAVFYLAVYGLEVPEK